MKIKDKYSDAVAEFHDRGDDHPQPFRYMVHFFHGTEFMGGYGCKTVEVCEAKVREFFKQRRPGKWIRRNLLDDKLYPEDQL